MKRIALSALAFAYALALASVCACGGDRAGQSEGGAGENAGGANGVEAGNIGTGGLQGGGLSFDIDLSGLEFAETRGQFRLLGFNYSASVGSRTYFFVEHIAGGDPWASVPGAPEHENVAAIRRVEGVIHGVQGILGPDTLGIPPLRIFLTQNEEHYWHRFGEAKISFDDVNTAGWLVHNWSGGRPPASAGACRSGFPSA